MDELVKQVIIIRKDLNMRKGKIAAQAAHASMKVFFDMFVKQSNPDPISFTLTLPSGEQGQQISEWIETIFTKVVCSVNSETELFEIYEKARAANLICSLIQDVGKTEFNGVPTYTCCAIGPAKSSLIDLITRHLPLL